MIIYWFHQFSNKTAKLKLFSRMAQIGYTISIPTEFLVEDQEGSLLLMLMKQHYS